MAASMSLAPARSARATARVARKTRAARVAVKAAADVNGGAPDQVIGPLNNDPFIGMFETPVTSSPLVASYLSGLPAYRASASPVLRGVEIGLAHGFFLPGPFYVLGPLRDTDMALTAGALSAAGTLLIAVTAMAMYGVVSFQDGEEQPETSLTLTGRTMAADPVQTADGWAGFSGGVLTGGLSGIIWATFLLNNGFAFVSENPIMTY
jgi:photosystem I subunit 11